MDLINPLTLDPGTQADWASAVGSILAASLAALAIIRDIRTRRDQRDELRQRAEVQRRSQARRVQVSEPRPYNSIISAREGEKEYCFSGGRVHVRNDSDETITDLNLVVQAIPKDDRFAKVVQSFKHGRLLPGELLWEHAVFEFRWPPIGETPNSEVAYLAALAFRDAADQMWLRDSHHRLRPFGPVDLFGEGGSDAPAGKPILGFIAEYE